MTLLCRQCGILDLQLCLKPVVTLPQSTLIFWVYFSDSLGNFRVIRVILSERRNVILLVFGYLHSHNQVEQPSIINNHLYVCMLYFHLLTILEIFDNPLKDVLANAVEQGSIQVIVLQFVRYLFAFEYHSLIGFHQIINRVSIVRF